MSRVIVALVVLVLPGVVVAADAGADLDRALVARTVRDKQGAVKACYEHALKINPRLAGRVDVRWTISQAGDVSGAAIESDTVGDRSLADCLVALVSRWKFDPGRGGSVDVTFPFVFQANDPVAKAPRSAGQAPGTTPLRTARTVGRDKVTVTLSGVDQRHDHQTPHLEIVARRAGLASVPVTLDLAPATHPELADVLQPSFSWELSSSAVTLGPRRAVRVSLSGRTGEDLAVVQEIAILVVADGDPKVLWIGLGDRLENRFDVCAIDTRASFRLAGDGKLERRLRSTRAVSAGAEDVEDGGDAVHRQGCKAPPPRTDLFSLPAQ